MRFRHIVWIPLILLTACGASAPSAPSQHRVSATGVYGKLLQLQLSGSWKTIDRSEQGEVLFAAPGASDALVPDATGVFRVHPLSSDSCATVFLIAKARLSFNDQLTPETAPRELSSNGAATDGYSWTEFTGTGSAKRAVAHHWCLSGSSPEIEVRAEAKDGSATAMVEKAFIPAWRRAIRNAGK